MSRARDLADLGSSADAGGLTGRNLIINGAMQVAQRGTSGTQASNYPSLDRWRFQESGVSYTVAQNDVSGTPTDYGFTKSMLVTNTAVGSNAASDYLFFQQLIEGQNIRNSGFDYQDSNSYLTYSFWAKSSLAGTYYAGIQLAEGNFAYPFTLAANTWTKVEFSVPGYSSLTSTSVPNTNATGWEFRIVPHWGTDFTASGTTTGEWIAFDGAARTDDYGQNWVATSGATFEITGCQIEVGQKATPFEHESFATTFEKCKRYFQKSYEYGTAIGTNTSLGCLRTRSSGTGWIHQSYLTTSLRGHPTVTSYSTDGTSGKIRDFSGGTNVNAGIDADSESSVAISGSVGGDAHSAGAQWTAEAEL